MYKRYYDGYHNAASNSRDKGEIITPKCTDDTYPKKDDCEEKNNSKELCICEEKQPCAELRPCEENKISCLKSEVCAASKSLFSLPGELDDIILAGILLLLLWDGDCADPIMLVIIGFVLLADVF